MKKFVLILILVAIMVPTFVHAQIPCSPVDGAGNRAPADLPRCVNQIYLWAIAIAAILAVLAIIAGGYQLMTASGNAQQATEGKERFIAAAIGLGILFSAYIILNTINPDLVNFSNLNPSNFPPSPASFGPNP